MAADTAGLRAGLIAAAAALAVVGVGLCQFFARPEPSAWAGGVSMAALSLLLGLGALPLLGGEPTVPPIAAAAGVWGAASVVGGWLQVAQRAGISPMRVGLVDMTIGARTGLPVLVGGLGALAVLGWCAVAARQAAPVPVVAVIAALGVLVVSVTGHGGESVWLPVVLGVHSVAAAWWAGTLAALVITVRGRGGWARLLPEFSARAAAVVAVLTGTGIVAALVRLGVGAQWWETGYGRILLAKVLLLAVTLGLAGWHRRTWVPRVRRHGIGERESIVRAGTELLVLSAVLGLAAGLATTGLG